MTTQGPWCLCFASAATACTPSKIQQETELQSRRGPGTDHPMVGRASHRLIVGRKSAGLRCSLSHLPALLATEPRPKIKTSFGAYACRRQALCPAHLSGKAGTWGRGIID